ncbi:hypothetical protein EJB05_14865, partial [Eragrostis curvula]
MRAYLHAYSGDIILSCPDDRPSSSSLREPDPSAPLANRRALSLSSTCSRPHPSPPPQTLAHHGGTRRLLLHSGLPRDLLFVPSSCGRRGGSKGRRRRRRTPTTSVPEFHPALPPPRSNAPPHRTSSHPVAAAAAAKARPASPHATSVSPGTSSSPRNAAAESWPPRVFKEKNSGNAAKVAAVAAFKSFVRLAWLRVDHALLCCIEKRREVVCGEWSKMSGNPVGVDNTSRRKFDKEEYLERARQRERQEKEDARKGKDRGPPVQRQPLKHRDYEVDLESRLGKTQVVTPIAPLSQQAGYYCSVCECVVKDSANYLDHINGKKHQRALGMSMRVERASLEQVQKRFEALKKRKDPSTFSEQDLDERIMKQQQEGEERKRQRKEKKKEKKKELAAQHESEDVDPDIAAMMGFGGFGSSKK